MLLVKLIVRKLKNIVYADPSNVLVKKGDLVLIQTENDLEVATVIEAEKDVVEKKVKTKKDNLPFAHYSIVRKCTSKDLLIIEENEKKTKQMKPICLEQVQAKKLDMKVTALEYTFNREKLFLYYTAEGRIDFRELIKDLTSAIKNKVQMVQIGVRDETKILGAVGHCGRVLCCKDFLTNFNPVVIDMAKEQDLSLNPTKISGVCGRLICCLSYEHEYYKEMSGVMPNVNDEVTTKDGTGRVKSRSILKQEVDVIFEGGLIQKYKADTVQIKTRAVKHRCSKSCKKCDNSQEKKTDEKKDK